MNYVDFLGHKVSKLICGDNPFNGWSYIPNFISGSEMRNFHTEDKILEAMHKMEELGINTMVPLAEPFMIRVIQHYRSNGGKMNFIFQTFTPILELDYLMDLIMSVDPIGAYHQGSTTDYNFETGDNEKTKALIKKWKQMGIPIGVGTHRSDVIELSEKEDWGADFYMRCMYNIREGREGTKSGFLTNKPKDGIVFRPEDRAKVLNDLQGLEKPVIAFKIFAGGQMLCEKTPEERRAAIKDTYNTIFPALKPNDIAAMGIFQKNFDQLSENVGIYEEWYKETQCK